MGEVSDPSKGRAALCLARSIGQARAELLSCPPTGRPATNEVCLVLVRAAETESFLSAWGP